MNGPTAPTPAPPLGWNSFDAYGCAATERMLLLNLDVMAARLKPAGYEYFIVDNGWFAEYTIPPGQEYPTEKHAAEVNLDAYGRLQPSHRAFPRGLQPLIERTHGLGLKFGLHLMRGIPRQAVRLNLPILGTPLRAQDVADTSSICAWCPYNYGVDMRKPGAQAFYDSLIHMLAGWGVDFIKADDITAYPDEISAMARAIARAGRPIVLSLSPGGAVDKRYLAAYQQANMLRTTKDIWDNRVSLERAFAAWRNWADVGGDGFWPDLDMLPFGHLMVWRPRTGPAAISDEASAALAGQGFARTCQLTVPQQQTFITMRALAASPLFMGGDLPTSAETAFALITNREMLACNQNGVVGRLVGHRAGCEIWQTPDRRRAGQGWLGVFNREQWPRGVALAAADLGLPSGRWRLRDIWHDRDLGELDTRDRLRADIAPDGVLFCRYQAV